MHTHLPVSVAAGKIMELENALFFNEGDALPETRTALVRALLARQSGEVWFLLRRPFAFLLHEEKEFPATLQFLKKGKRFSLKITGKCMVAGTQPLGTSEGIPAPLQGIEIPEKNVLVKIQILYAEYFDYSVTDTGQWWKRVEGYIGRWMAYKNTVLQLPDIKLLIKSMGKLSANIFH